jgi:phosphatidate phosphatase PAH1
MELERRERFWIDELKPELNKAVPHQTYDEYYEKNKEAIFARTKEYYQNNIDTVAEKKSSITLRIRKAFVKEANSIMRTTRRKFYSIKRNTDKTIAKK